MKLPISEFIIEEMEYRKWDNKKLAIEFGLTEEVVNNILQDKQEVNEEIICSLSRTFGQSIDYWINLSKY